MSHQPPPTDLLQNYWSLDPEQVIQVLHTTKDGLGFDEESSETERYYAI